MPQKKSVIFITGSLGGGGAEKVISILASGCAELGADVTLVVLRERDVAYSVSDKVNLIQIRSHGKLAPIQRIKKLHQILKSSKADTVIPFTPIVTLYTILANIGIGKKIIMSERADPSINVFTNKMSMYNRVGSFLIRNVGLHKLASWTVFQTPDAQSWYSPKVQEKSSIIFNPLDTSHLPQRYEGEREKRIVAAGRFTNQKNFTMLIAGFNLFHISHPDYSLYIYGKGNERENLEDQVKNLGLSDCVAMPGFAKNLPEQIYKSAIYVSTSNFEGISNSMLEALAMGIPTIVTDCPVGGARLFVHTDDNGILIPINDVDALAAGMTKIADDAEYAEKISKNATAIREQLTADVICRQWLDLI